MRHNYLRARLKAGEPPMGVNHFCIGMLTGPPSAAAQKQTVSTCEAGQ